MKKIFLLLLIPFLLVACGTTPKQIVTEAINKLKLVDNYQENLLAIEEVNVLYKTTKRKIEIEKEIDLENKTQKVETKIEKDGEELEESEYYLDEKQKLRYTQDRITNEWQKEPKQSDDFLDFSILTDEKVEVKEVKSSKTSLRKYKIELSTEDMKRLFYRNINEEYVSMLITKPGEVYLYVNTAGYLTKVEIDLTKIIDMQDPDSTCKKLKLQFNYEDYNDFDPVTIPDYVTKTAIKK